MIYTYSELKNNGLDNYNINKKVANKELYKIESGLYSDTEKYNPLEYIVKRYPNSIFTSESAFFYLGLTDYIPSKYFLATKHNVKKILNNKIEQIFMANHLFEIGKSQVNYNNVQMNVYNKERMLIELIRKKKQIPFDYYKEIISNYRALVDELDMYKIEEYLALFKNDMNLSNILQMEVF